MQHQYLKMLKGSKTARVPRAMKKADKQDSFYGNNQAVFELGRTSYFPRVDSNSSMNGEALKKGMAEENVRIPVPDAGLSSDAFESDFGSKRVKFEQNLVNFKSKQSSPNMKAEPQSSCLRRKRQTLGGRLNMGARSQSNLLEPSTIGD